MIDDIAPPEPPLRDPISVQDGRTRAGRAARAVVLDPIFGQKLEKTFGEYGVTLQERDDFLKVLSMTANVSKATNHVFKGKRSIANYRKSLYRLRYEDDEFRQQWDEAIQLGIEAQEDEMRRRAFQGVSEPVFYQGVEVATVKKYSDTLAMFLMKGAKPERYRERVEIDQHVDNVIRDASDADLNKQIIDGLAKLGVRIREIQTIDATPTPAGGPADTSTATTTATLPAIDPHGSHSAFLHPVLAVKRRQK